MCWRCSRRLYLRQRQSASSGALASPFVTGKAWSFERVSDQRHTHGAPGRLAQGSIVFGRDVALFVERARPYCPIMTTGVYVTVPEDLANCLVDDGFTPAGATRGIETVLRSE